MKKTERQAEFLRISELAKVLGVHPSTLYKAVERGEVPHTRVGGSVLIPRSYLEQKRAEAGVGGR